jgi:hypothetical protein
MCSQQACDQVYFKTSEETISTDPDKISEEVFPQAVECWEVCFEF